MPATIIEHTEALDVLNEASAIIRKAIQTTANSQAHRAEICGCRGCKAQAMQVATWAVDMLDAA